MEINANFDERVSVHASQLDWRQSSSQGIERKILDRIGEEIARATLLVRLAPTCNLADQIYQGGVEFFILQGTLQDENRDYPAGTYVRNPRGSGHKPHSQNGCTLFVKLWQFQSDDREQISIDTNTENWEEEPGRLGVALLPLFKNTDENVYLEKWAPNTPVDLEAPNGMEIFVLEGEYAERKERFTRHSWLRMPRKTKTSVVAGENGTTVWIKRNHLKTIPDDPVA